MTLLFKPRREVVQLSAKMEIFGFHRDDIMGGAIFAMTLGEKLKSAMPNLFIGLIVWAVSSLLVIWITSMIRESLPPSFITNLIDWAKAPRRYEVDMESQTVPLHL